MSEETKGCHPTCSPGASSEALNDSCHCISLDQSKLTRLLEADLGERGLAASMLTTHPNLFASLPVFLPRRHVDRIAQVVAIIEEVTRTAEFRSRALTWAPESAQFDPGSRGGLLGFDFHLTSAGPRLIEINTNPGGALINAVLGRAQRYCCQGAEISFPTAEDSTDFEASILDVLLDEWRSQRGFAPLRRIAIVDEKPSEQFLYPEFLLFRNLLQRQGLESIICDPSELVYNGGLWYQGQRVDFVYNRLTDFALQAPLNAAIRTAYLAGEVALSPHPRAHAIYADKRNLSLLGNKEFLATTHIEPGDAALLRETIPVTVLMNAGNRAELWANRRRLFFKPAGGYGSRATYRGDKLTKRVWDEICSGTYVAQEFVPPGERRLASGITESPLKVDARAYAYAGAVKLIAARLYQGQTTNFRTAGGGFAPVLTTRSG